MNRIPLLLLIILLAFCSPKSTNAQDEQSGDIPFDNDGYFDSSLATDIVNLPLCSPPSGCTNTGQPDGAPITGDFVRILGADGGVYVFPTPETEGNLANLTFLKLPIAWIPDPDLPQITFGTADYSADEVEALLITQGLDPSQMDSSEAFLAFIQAGGLLGNGDVFMSADWQAYFAAHPDVDLSYLMSYALDLYAYSTATCQEIPGLCPVVAPPVSACPTPVLSQGRILVTAYKIAPNFPLVVGQDEEERGADVSWEVRIEPTIYTWWTSEPIYDTVCSEWHTGDPARDCRTKPSMWYDDGITKTKIVSYTCISHTQIYTESLHRVSALANLSRSSRDWILNTLSIRYPGAYLHNPDFSWAGNHNTGSFQGYTFVWTFSRSNIPFADPGWFDLGASGSTSGTPISDPRGFNLPGGQVEIYLKEVVIIQ